MSHQQEAPPLKTPSVYVPGPAHYPRILTYHEISERFHLGITCITPDSFRAHLDFLAESAVPIIGLRDLSSCLPDRDKKTVPAVSITFDDGYQSFYDEVFPTLTERKMAAALFVVTHYVGCTNDWDITFGLNKRRHLDWSMIREISNHGIEIGSHGHTHRDLTHLSVKDCHRELLVSKNTLEEKLGIPITSLALPFGSATLTVFQSAKECGYDAIYGSVPGLYGPFPGVLPRIPVYKGDTTKAIRRKLALTSWEMIRLNLLHACSKGTRLLKR